jgi:hypothetical protein
LVMEMQWVFCGRRKYKNFISICWTNLRLQMPAITTMQL